MSKWNQDKQRYELILNINGKDVVYTSHAPIELEKDE